MARPQLTAAHCADAFAATNPVFISRTTPGDPGKSNEVAQFVQHEGYIYKRDNRGVPIDIQNDIAVFSLKMESNEPLTAWSRNILEPSVRDEVRIVGFGIIQWNQPLSGADQLRQTTLTVLDNADCSNGNTPGFSFFQVGQMACASSSNSSPCSGDSGSPFFDTASNNIVGVLSFSANLCPRGVPIVMMRVSHYDQWIHDQICLISAYPPPSCFIPIECGDTKCTPGKENATTCPEDCPVVKPPPCDSFICSFFAAIAAGFGFVVSSFYFCF